MFAPAYLVVFNACSDDLWLTVISDQLAISGPLHW